jgi:hypothetical protein
MTIRIREASPRALKKITLDFADGSSVEGVIGESHFLLAGTSRPVGDSGSNWHLDLRADLLEFELRAPPQKCLGALDSISLTYTPQRDGYTVTTSAEPTAPSISNVDWLPERDHIQYSVWNPRPRNE